MIIQEKEPYEDNLLTRAIWNESKKVSKVKLKRNSKNISILWQDPSEVYADKLTLFDIGGEWQCEIQAMTQNRFHLHITSLLNNNKIIYSGIINKIKFWQELMFIFG